MPPVTAPHIVCAGCGTQTSLWAPLCPTCQSIADETDDEPSPRFVERRLDELFDRSHALEND